MIGNPEGFTFDDLSNPDVRKKVGDLTFAAATDGNHGRGVAWAATRLGFKSVIYVHKLTSEARINAIASNGAEVKVIDGNYDDAVRQVNEDAQKNGWQVISDTSWEGYEEIPVWVMQGYTTMFSEVQQQLVPWENFAPHISSCRQV
jgi:diaminopropionate ammonia-lyase